MSQEPKFEPGWAMFDAHYSAMPFTWADAPEFMRKLFADREGKVIRAFMSEARRQADVNGQPFGTAIRHMLAQYPEPPTKPLSPAAK